MRTITCNSCSFRTSEDDKSWDKAISNVSCPKCNVKYEKDNLPEGISSQPTKLIKKRAEGYNPDPSANIQNIVITDINVPFWVIVRIIVKWAIASIPATLILLLIYLIVIFLLDWLGINHAFLRWLASFA